MPGDRPPPERRLATRLLHEGRPGIGTRAFVSPPMHRGSTMLHVDTADRPPSPSPLREP